MEPRYKYVELTLFTSSSRTTTPAPTATRATPDQNEHKAIISVADEKAVVAPSTQELDVLIKAAKENLESLRKNIGESLIRIFKDWHKITGSWQRYYASDTYVSFEPYSIEAAKKDHPLNTEIPVVINLIKTHNLLLISISKLLDQRPIRNNWSSGPAR